MLFFKALFASLALSAGCASAQVAENAVTFVSLDNIGRTMYFASNPQCEEMEPVSVPGGESVRVVFPYAWQGNGFAVTNGEPIIPGMLAEFAFNCNMDGADVDKIYFDVSAIVNPTDTNGVKRLLPAQSLEPISGCHDYTSGPCDNCYNYWDDPQTKATTDFELICELGTAIEEIVVKPRSSAKFAKRSSKAQAKQPAAL